MSTLLQITDVTKHYNNQPRLALDHVSFQVNRGEFLGIMDASGSGKTTLLNVLSTISRADSGEISMNGTKIQTLNQAQAANLYYPSAVPVIMQSLVRQTLLLYA